MLPRLTISVAACCSAALTAIVFMAACSEQPDNIVGPDPAITPASSSSAQSPRRVATPTADVSSKPWFDISIDAKSTFHVGHTVALTVEYTAHYATALADLRVTLPEIEHAKRSGWGRTYRTALNSAVPGAVQARRALTAGETFTQTTSFSVPAPGLYRRTRTSARAGTAAYGRNRFDRPHLARDSLAPHQRDGRSCTCGVRFDRHTGGLSAPARPFPSPQGATRHCRITTRSDNA